MNDKIPWWVIAKTTKDPREYQKQEFEKETKETEQKKDGKE